MSNQTGWLQALRAKLSQWSDTLVECFRCTCRPGVQLCFRRVTLFKDGCDQGLRGGDGGGTDRYVVRLVDAANDSDREEAETGPLICQAVN